MKSMEENLQGGKEGLLRDNLRNIFEMLLWCKEKANQA